LTTATTTHALAAPTSTHTLTAALTAPWSASGWNRSSSASSAYTSCRARAARAARATRTGWVTRSGRGFFFFRFWVWLRCNQTIDGHHGSQINIGRKTHFVRTNRNTSGCHGDAY
jgi:hypothetical protein